MSIEEYQRVYPDTRDAFLCSIYAPSIFGPSVLDFGGNLWYIGFKTRMETYTPFPREYTRCNISKSTIPPQGSKSIYNLKKNAEKATQAGVWNWIYQQKFVIGVIAESKASVSFLKTHGVGGGSGGGLNNGTRVIPPSRFILGPAPAKLFTTYAAARQFPRSTFF